MADEEADAGDKLLKWLAAQPDWMDLRLVGSFLMAATSMELNKLGESKGKALTAELQELMAKLRSEDIVRVFDEIKGSVASDGFDLIETNMTAIGTK